MKYLADIVEEMLVESRPGFMKDKEGVRALYEQKLEDAGEQAQNKDAGRNLLKGPGLNHNNGGPK